MAEPRLYLRGRIFWTWFLDADGVRHQVSTKCRDKRAARDRALELEREVAAAGGRKPKERLTLVRALDEALLQQERNGRAKKTRLAAEYHAAHLTSVLGDVAVDTLTAGRMADYVATRLGEGASKHTIQKEVGFLTQALRGAARRELWEPRRDPGLLAPDEVRSRVYVPRERFLTRHEYIQLHAAVVPSKKDYVAAWCYLGLRKSELFDIQPGDYDATTHRLRVRGTKTEGADRLVPVAEAVRDVLARRCQRPVPFPPWKAVWRDLATAAERAGIPTVTPNDLRRTFASWLIQAGVPERVIAEMLGHTSTQMVRSVYGRLDMASMEKAVERL